MKPGRELDVLVAERVMGVKVRWDVLCSGTKIPYVEGTLCQHIGHYSTDIIAAWEVVKELDKVHKIYISTSELFIPGWCVELAYGERPAIVDAETVELAICLAALKSKGLDP
jgi:hypothetical protein